MRLHVIVVFEIVHELLEEVTFTSFCWLVGACYPRTGPNFLGAVSFGTTDKQRASIGKNALWRPQRRLLCRLAYKCRMRPELDSDRRVCYYRRITLPLNLVSGLSSHMTCLFLGPVHPSLIEYCENLRDSLILQSKYVLGSHLPFIFSTR